MPQVLIVYFSHSGNTKKMAGEIARAVEAGGCEVLVKKVSEVNMDEVALADGLLLGSPCYFGVMAAPMKQFVDESIKLFGKGELQGKPGGAFCSTGGIGGLGEVALLSMNTALMIHGMVLQGVRKGGHYGPLAITEPDQRALTECKNFGAQFAALVKKLAA